MICRIELSSHGRPDYHRSRAEPDHCIGLQTNSLQARPGTPQHPDHDCCGSSRKYPSPERTRSATTPRSNISEDFQTCGFGQGLEGELERELGQELVPELDRAMGRRDSRHYRRRDAGNNRHGLGTRLLFGYGSSDLNSG